MNNIRICETRNKRLIRELAQKFDADMHAIDTIILTWIYRIGNKNNGIIGVNRWKKDFATIDLFVSKECPYQEKMMHSLVRFIINKAKQRNIEEIFCHMGHEKAGYFLRNDFTYINDNNLPKKYICSCHLCDEFQITCNPKPLKWKNK